MIPELLLNPVEFGFGIVLSLSEKYCRIYFGFWLIEWDWWKEADTEKRLGV
jgi:hypothetical protein